jgi:hypothetical protein
MKISENLHYCAFMADSTRDMDSISSLEEVKGYRINTLRSVASKRKLSTKGSKQKIAHRIFEDIQRKHAKTEELRGVEGVTTRHVIFVYLL